MIAYDCDRLNTISSVIHGGYCVGCGACVGLQEPSMQMVFTEAGIYLPAEGNGFLEDAASVCPFSGSGKNEDELSRDLFHSADVQQDKFIGHSLACYAGYVKAGSYRKAGSSGGVISWLAAKLLENKLVDGIIHVKESRDGDGILFKYGVSYTAEEVKLGAKSRYYPIEIAEVMRQVLSMEGRYAFVGVPCFVKAVRLLAEKEPTLRNKIPYTIGIVCGHLKTDWFAKALAWEMGIPPKDLSSIDFRVKTDTHPANWYQVMAQGRVRGEFVQKQEFAKNLYASNWGYGFFKLKACDYCDDVVAETADISVGDAWLPEYVSDPAGNSVVVVRSQAMMDLVLANWAELCFNPITPAKVFQSQAGGFRHRREGLSYRLHLLDQQGSWYPPKRVKAGRRISGTRRKIYAYRMRLREESHAAIKHAEEADDFGAFVAHMQPYIDAYERLNQPRWYRKWLTLPIRVLRGMLRRIAALINLQHK